MPITRLYVDTNVLVRGRWPNATADLDVMFSSAARVGVQAFLPALVEMEVDAQWNRDLEKAKAQALSKVRALATHTTAFQSELALPTTEVARDAYNVAVAAARERWHLQTCPTTNRTLEELLKMSARHDHPFPDTDSSFRDAIVMLSIADHLDQLDAPSEALLVSGDNFFVAMKEFRTQKGSIIRIREDAKTATDEDLISLFVGVVVDNWQQEQAQAKAVLTADLENIQQFVRDNLEVPVGFGLLILGPRVLEVRGITAGEIGRVTVPLPFRRPADGEVAVSFEMAVSIDQVIEVSRSAPTPNTLRLGQTWEQLAPAYTPPTREQTTETATVVVQATGRVQASQYVGFSYISVAMRPAQATTAL